MQGIDGISEATKLVPGLKEYASMKPVPLEEYREYVRKNDHVTIGGKKISLLTPKPRKIQPDSFQLETTTVWSFPERGKWATHRYNASYRGNWAPQIPRNIIQMYTEPHDTVLDPFMGSGTTIIECQLLSRKCIGVDINYQAVMLAWSRLEPVISNANFPSLYVGDARNLDLIPDESVDLIATHPPYAGMIKYTGESNSSDLSSLRSLSEYLLEMRVVLREMWRVLKPGGHLALMIGDMRKRKHIVPLGFRVLELMLSQGFILKEHVIKIQHNMQGTRKWIGRNKGFLLIKHEHIFVVRKPLSMKDYSKFKESSKWW